MTPSPVPYKIVMTVHGRPIYTYMTLDALARTTHSPYRLTIVHHRTGPTLNDEIIQSFINRGVIHNVVEQTAKEFDWSAFAQTMCDSVEREDEFVFRLDDDVVIEPSETCWIGSMVAAMRADPKLAMVGSAIDKRDFIDPGALAVDLGRALTAEERQMIKSDSPERKQKFAPNQGLFTGHNVAGRFLGLRIAALAGGVPILDSLLDKALKERGWKTGTLAAIRHRHLSLVNYYDYRGHHKLRNEHFHRTRKRDAS